MSLPLFIKGQVAKSGLSMNRNSFFAPPRQSIGIHRLQEKALQFLGDVLDWIHKAVDVCKPNSAVANEIDSCLRELTKEVGGDRNIQQAFNNLSRSKIFDLVNQLKDHLDHSTANNEDSRRRASELVTLPYEKISKSLSLLCPEAAEQQQAERPAMKASA